MARPLGPSQEQRNWISVWGPTITNLTTDKEVLGAKNGLMKKHLENDDMRGLAAAFVKSLIDDKQPPQLAQQALDKMRLLLPIWDPQGQANRPLPATKFPTNTYKQLLELVSAKMLWWANHTWIEPGSQKGGSKLKPDYGFQGRLETAEAGDHVVVQGAKTEDDLIKQIARDLSLKLTKYNAVPAVFVVIHVTECPAYGALKKLDHDGWWKIAAGAVASLNPKVLEHFSRLVIIAGDNAHVFQRDALKL